MELPDPRRLPPDALLTAAQVAGILGTSRMQIWRLVRRGALAPPVKIGPEVQIKPGARDGRRNHWRAQDLLVFLDARMAARDRAGAA